MCGRYTNTKDLSELAKSIQFITRILFQPRYNIAPTQSAPVIVQDRIRPEMRMMRWGLIPNYAKSESVGSALINARAETLTSRPSFKQAYQSRRCLVPADSFFEWQERGGKKQPFRIMPKDTEPLCFAGLWERWVKPASSDSPETDLDEPAPSQIVESFTIITTEANTAIKPLHNRMPVIVQPQHYGWWLDCGLGNEMHGFVLNHPDSLPLKIYPVSAQVNGVKTDDPRCIEPVQIERVGRLIIWF